MPRVFADVAQDVRHLHRAAERDAVAGRVGRARAEDRHHQQADRRRDEVAVLAQRVVRRIAADRDVHPRAAQQIQRGLDRDAEPPCGVGERDEDRIRWFGRRTRRSACVPTRRSRRAVRAPARCGRRCRRRCGRTRTPPTRRGASPGSGTASSDGTSWNARARSCRTRGSIPPGARRCSGSSAGRRERRRCVARRAQARTRDSASTASTASFALRTAPSMLAGNFVST